MDNPSVSIVIPAYNEERMIRQCVESCVHQTVQAKEIIVVDNMSTDKTVQVVEQLIKKHKNKANIILLHEDEKQGITPARDRGFNAVTADIIGRTDADAILSPTWVEQTAMAFLDETVASITGPATYYDMPLRRPALKVDSSLRRICSMLGGKFTLLFGTNMGLRRSVWEELREFTCLDPDNEMHEDVDLTMHLVEHNFRIKYVSSVVVGMSARRIEDDRKAFHKYQKRISTTFKRHGYNPAIAKAPQTIFLSIHPILHGLRPMYMRRYNKSAFAKNNQLWKEGGIMSPYHTRISNKVKSGFRKLSE